MKRRFSRRLAEWCARQLQPSLPIWVALRDVFGRRHATYYYRCANADEHPGVIVTWDAFYGARNHNICPKCGGVAQSAVRKTKTNVRFQRFVRRLLHGV